MNRVKLLSAAAVLLTALSAPAFAQGRGGDGGAAPAAGGAAGGGTAGGAAMSGPGPAGGMAGGGAAGGSAITSGGGSRGDGLAVSGGRGGQYGGNSSASSRSGIRGSTIRDSSGTVGAGAVREGGTRSFAADRHDGGWRGAHRGHGGRFFVGSGYDSYAYDPDCYSVRKRVLTRFGWRVQRVRVCD
jgi:hypothetical protein